MGTSLLVTGGAGFIGSNLVKFALPNQHVDRVVVVDDLSTGDLQNLKNLDVEIYEASILDSSAMGTALKGIDAVVHLAAIPSVPRSIANPVATHAANATGTLNVLEACRASGVQQVVAASSSSVYGSNPAMPKHEREWIRPMSPYAVSKAATEQYLLAYQNSFGLSTLPFRFFNVYGPGQAAGHAYAAVIPAFLDALLRGRPLPVNGDGMQSRDFTFVETVCEILLEASINRMSSVEPVNLAFGVRTNLLDLVKILESVTGLAAQLEFRAVRPGDVPHSLADNSSLVSLFPNIRSTELRDGIRSTVDWFRESETCN